jgi:hypothetical protein
MGVETENCIDTKHLDYTKQLSDKFGLRIVKASEITRVCHWLIAERPLSQGWIEYQDIHNKITEKINLRP